LLASTHMNVAGQFSLQLDEVTSSRKVTVIPGVRAVVWSADGRYLFTGGARIMGDRGNYEDKVWACQQVWEVACHVPTYLMREPIERLLFRPDGQQLAINGTVWDVLPGKVRPLLRRTPIEAPEQRLAFCGKEVWATNLARGRKNELWEDLDTDPVLDVASLVGFPGPLGSQSLLSVPASFAFGLPNSWRRPLLVRIAPPGKSVVLALPGDKEAWLEKTMKERVKRHHSPLHKGTEFLPGCFPDQILQSPDGKTAVVRVLGYGFDRLGGNAAPAGEYFLEMWNLETGQRRSLVGSRSVWPEDAAFHPNGQLLVTVGRNGVQLWDLTQGTVVKTLSDHANSGRAVWSLDGRHLLVVKKYEKATVFETEGRRVREWPAPGGEWNAFTLNKDAQWVITGGEDRMLRIRDVQSGKELAAWQGHDSPITALTFSPDGRFLVSGARDGTIRVWDLPWIRDELTKLGLNW
jgi:hypothetical protein